MNRTYWHHETKHIFFIAFLTFLVVSAVLMSGCAAHNFTPSDLSGKSNQKAELIITTAESPESKVNEASIKRLEEILKDNPEELNKVKDLCLVKAIPKITGLELAAPIIIAAIQAGYNIHMDRIKRELEKLKEAATASYSGKTFISPEHLRRCQCAILVRHSVASESEKPTDKSTQEQKPKYALGLIAVTQPVANSGAFSFEPRYAVAYNSVAITSKEKPQLSISIGYSLKALGMQQNKLPGLAVLGTGSVSLPKRTLSDSPEAFKCQKGGCPQTDLIPYPPAKYNSTLSMSMSVTETGSIGFDVNQRAAEITALKEAIGPAIGTSLGLVIANEYAEDE